MRTSTGTYRLRPLRTRRVYRLYDFTKSLALEANVFYCVAGKVNSADKLYLVIESVKRDIKHAWSSTAHPHVDGAEGGGRSPRPPSEGVPPPASPLLKPPLLVYLQTDRRGAIPRRR